MQSLFLSSFRLIMYLMDSAKAFDTSTVAHCLNVQTESNYNIWSQLMHKDFIFLWDFGNHFKHQQPKSSQEKTFENHYLVILQLWVGLATSNPNPIILINVAELLHNIKITGLHSGLPEDNMARFRWSKVTVIFLNYCGVFLSTQFLSLRQLQSRLLLSQLQKLAQQPPFTSCQEHLRHFGLIQMKSGLSSQRSELVIKNKLIQ